MLIIQAATERTSIRIPITMPAIAIPFFEELSPLLPYIIARDPKRTPNMAINHPANDNNPNIKPNFALLLVSWVFTGIG